MTKKFSGKKILVLGAMRSLNEFVQRIKEYGIEVLVADYLEDSPAKKYADKAILVDLLDVDAVVEVCKREKVDGIVTGFVDLLLPYYAQICEKTGLPCYGTYEHFCIMTDKKKFKELCRRYGVLTISEYKPEDDISYPVLIKPIDSSGSRGISVCGNKEELEAGIEKALSYSPSKQYMIEKYMTGDEIVLYYYFQNGTPVFMGMCDRYVNKEQYGVAQVSTAYVFPSKYTRNHLEHTDAAIKNMFKGIGVQNGSMFLQAFADDGLPCLYEPGYRLNGAREHYIFGDVNGINAMDMLINFALTGEMSEEDIEAKSTPELNGKVACMLCPILKTGTITRIEGMEKIRAMESVKQIVMINDLGDTIKDEVVGTLRQLGYRVYVVADTIEELKRDLDYIIENVVFYDENGNSMMLSPFDTNELLRNYCE